jgi:hypothetical protein
VDRVWPEPAGPLLLQLAEIHAWNVQYNHPWSTDGLDLAIDALERRLEQLAPGSPWRAQHPHLDVHPSWLHLGTQAAVSRHHRLGQLDEAAALLESRAEAGDHEARRRLVHVRTDQGRRKDAWELNWSLFIAGDVEAGRLAAEGLTLAGRDEEAQAVLAFLPAASEPSRASIYGDSPERAWALPPPYRDRPREGFDPLLTADDDDRLSIYCCSSRLRPLLVVLIDEHRPSAAVEVLPYAPLDGCDAALAALHERPELVAACVREAMEAGEPLPGSVFVDNDSEGTTLERCLGGLVEQHQDYRYLFHVRR